MAPHAQPSRQVPHLPRQVPIDAYGNGGFRFGGMSHQGSILCLPSGVWGWAVSGVEALDLSAFERVFETPSEIAFLILGTGVSLVRPPPAVAALFNDVGLGLEVMDTGAAARTYNVLLAEGRRVGAALIAVD